MDYSEQIERLRDAIATGGAVCLLGAGFSVVASDQKNKPIPSSSDLVDEIKKSVGIDQDDTATLADIADFCEESSDLQRSLRLLIGSRLTQTRPSDDQKIILNNAWRSIFTTNFDDVIEQCISSIKLQIITPLSRNTNRKSNLLPLYYLHGRARDLFETDQDPRLVISERNYLNLHSDNRDLYAQLKNELFAAKLIVIIGYSMRDLEVARMLIEPGHAFHKKTIVICSPEEKGIALARLRKFGQVLPIGVSGLAENLEGLKALSQSALEHPQFIEIAQIPKASTDIVGDDFVRLILTGNFQPDKYQAQLLGAGETSEIYCIRRSEALSTITNRPLNGLNRFVVSSDLGNGKTIFLDQLAIELMATGHKIVRISSVLDEIFPELDQVLSSGQPVAFLIDDVIRYRIATQYIGSRLNNLSILVCCMRGAPEEVVYQNLTDSLGGSAKQIDLNRLSVDDLRDWDMALERWGLWESRIQLSAEARLKFLQSDCGGENRSIVLSLFRTSHIAKRIDQIVEFFLNSSGHKRTFTALLTSSLCQQHVTWESLVSWLDIDEQALRRDISRSEISDLFGSGRNWNAFTSAQLAEYILRTRYIEDDKDTLVEVFSEIVLRTSESAGDTRLGAIFRENLKELMKFRFLTRLFGDDVASMQLINRVYTRLAKAPLIRKNPQFWLQHAMARMEVGDLPNAETYLNTSLGLAKERGLDYSPFQILDQRSRLYFRKNTGISSRFSKIEIRQAVSDLDSSLDNPDSEAIYLFRSTPLIRDFIEDQIDNLDQDLKSILINLLTRIKEMGKGHRNLPRSQKGETIVLQRALDDALRTLQYG